MSHPPRVQTLIVSLVFAAGVPACSQAPTRPSEGSPGGSIAPSTSAVADISGVVFETTGQTRRPIEGARVTVVDVLDGPYGWLPWYATTTDVNGRFTVAGAVAGRLVKLTAYEHPGSGPLNQSDLLQVHGVRHTVGDGTIVEIELVRRGVQPGPSESPTLSGIVFENGSNGRRPAADVGVLFSSNGHDGADVYTRTDDDGRYTFWNLPHGPGSLATACRQVNTPPPNIQMVRFDVQIQGGSELNVTCP